MRYITIPEPVPLPAAPDGYTFDDLLEEQVWTHTFWRDAPGRDRSDMLFALAEKFKGTKAGDVVELTDAEYETLLPIACMRGIKLAPQVALPLQRMMVPLFAAPSKRPTPDDDALRLAGT